VQAHATCGAGGRGGRDNEPVDDLAHCEICGTGQLSRTMIGRAESRGLRVVLILLLLLLLLLRMRSRSRRSDGAGESCEPHGHGRVAEHVGGRDCKC
jgi:hypothetical protein